MTRIVASSSPGEVGVAVVEGSRLVDYALWRPGQPDGLGDIHRGRVIAHVPGMAGAFVALPGLDGFLPDSEGGAGAVEGALLTVRITRAAQGGKGPRLAAMPAMAGGAGLVTRGPDPLTEFAEQHPDAAITVDDTALLARLRPRFGDRAGLAPFDPALAEAIEALAEPIAVLPAGMRASIHPTPALVAIDLDMAAATAARAPQASAQLAANLAALPALARQIRLRNLSGAILLDPAGLGVRRRAKLAPALAAALAEDPLQPRLLGFTALGLAEIVRRRVRPPLHELLAGPGAAGLAALRQIAREAAAAPHCRFGLSCAPDVAAALAADDVALADLARRTGRALIPVSDPTLAPATWRIERQA